MGRSPWCCRNPGCPVQFGAILGSRTRGGDLELAGGVDRFAVDLPAGRASVRCPACGARREFRGGSIFSARR